jgi:hypothetical protein
MEAAGLAFGIAGLAGLFNTGLGIVEKVDCYRDFGVESRSLIAQFEADRVRFRQWGQKAGINAEGQKEHHEALDDPAISSVVSKLLQSIKDIDEVADYDSVDGQPASQPGALKSFRRLQFDNANGVSSRMSRISWSLRDKSRFLALVQSFSTLVQKLYELVPPDRLQTLNSLGAKTNQNLLEGAFIGCVVHDLWRANRLVDDMSRLTGVQTLMLELEKQLHSKVDLLPTIDH